MKIYDWNIYLVFFELSWATARNLFLYDFNFLVCSPVRLSGISLNTHALIIATKTLKHEWPAAINNFLISETLLASLTDFKKLEFFSSCLVETILRVYLNQCQGREGCLDGQS